MKTSLDHDHIIFNQWAPSRIARNSKVLAALGPTGQPRVSDRFQSDCSYERWAVGFGSASTSLNRCASAKAASE